MINIFRATVYIIYGLSIDFLDTVYDQNSMPNIFILPNYIIGRCSKDIRHTALIIDSTSKRIYTVL